MSNLILPPGAQPANAQSAILTRKDLGTIVWVLNTVAVYGYGNVPSSLLVPHPVEAGRLADLLEQQIS